MSDDRLTTIEIKQDAMCKDISEIKDALIVIARMEERWIAQDKELTLVRQDLRSIFKSGVIEQTKENKAAIKVINTRTWGAMLASLAALATFVMELVLKRIL